MEATYGIISIVPVIVLIVVALLTKRTFESLLVATLLALIIGYQGEWFSALIEQMQEVAANDIWVLLVVGLLGGVTVTGFVVAVFMSNAGGAWDNAKKYIESGHHGGKGSECHKSAVIGDTVGDPFKDTSGPSLNILIKLCSTVSIVFSGLVATVSSFIL